MALMENALDFSMKSQSPDKRQRIDSGENSGVSSPQQPSSTSSPQMTPVHSAINFHPSLFRPFEPPFGALPFPSLVPDSSMFLPTASLALSTLHKRRKVAVKSPKKDESTHSDEQKDDQYWERRRKNNEAAKRSRDTRRQKEEEIAMRATILEQENLKLRAQVAVLKNETAKLHYMLFANATQRQLQSEVKPTVL